jgi:hypothetical protein
MIGTTAGGEETGMAELRVDPERVKSTIEVRR